MIKTGELLQLKQIRRRDLKPNQNIMIQTIVLIENGKYPFGQVTSIRKSIKVEDVRVYHSVEHLRQQKLKMQNIFNSCDKTSQTTTSSTDNTHLIKLVKIYQQDLTLHFIFQYVPYSLSQFIANKIIPEIDLDKSQVLEMNSKLFLKKVTYQLGVIISFLVKRKIRANLDYDMLGVDHQENLKFFINADCSIWDSETSHKIKKDTPLESNEVQDQLKAFYETKKQAILLRLQSDFRKMKKIENHVPNFVIQGNRLVFSQPLIDIQSSCYSPCPSNFTQTSFTERCQSIDGQFLDPGDSIRKTHSNLFTKLKKTQSYNYNTQSNKKLQQNLVKLEGLRKKSKKLNDELKQSYLSNSQCFPANTSEKDEGQFNRRGSTQFQQDFSKRLQTERQEEEWRNSEISQKLRKTHLPKGSTAKSPNRFGGMNLDSKRSKSNRNHKSSFQFKPKQDRQWFNPNRSFDKGFQDDFQENYQKSRSIRIEVEQKQTKQRKSSFKVKILTCQEVEMDGQNVEEFVFNAMNKNFNQNKFGENDEGYESEESENGRKSNRSYSSRYSQRFKNPFSQKFKQQQKGSEMNTKFSESPIKQHLKERDREGSSQKNIFEKYYEQFGNDKEKSSKNPQLQEKIKLAKQKAESILNQYMKNKKLGSKNSNSKYGM